MRRFLKTHNKEQAQSLVEMALVLPILIFMLIGLFEISYAIWGSLTLKNIDRETTRFAVRQGALDYSEYTASDIGYSNVITHALVSNARQLKLQEYLHNAAGEGPQAAIIVTHIVVDTQEPCKGLPGCATSCSPDEPLDDLIVHPDMQGYEYLRYVYPPDTPFGSTINIEELAEQLKEENDNFNCRLAQKGSNEWSNNSVIVVEMFYEQPQLLEFPLFSWMMNPVFLSAQTTMRIDSQDQSRCEVYPIALSINTLNGWTTNGEERDIWNGGSFMTGDWGWLAWNDSIFGSMAPDMMGWYLTDELENPRLAQNDFIDAHDFSDTHLNYAEPGGDSDYVASFKMSPAMTGFPFDTVSDALDKLIGKQIMVPVYDSFSGGMPVGSYHIHHFALVQITSYNIPSMMSPPMFFNHYINAKLIDDHVDYACP